MPAAARATVVDWRREFSPRTTRWRRTTAAGSRAARSSRSTSSVRPAPARPRCSNAPSAILRGELPLSVIEGDQATANDGERIRAAGAPAVQINTGTGCHLDADMVARGARRAEAAARLGGADRECRQSRLPGAVRSRRARQSRDLFGDRRRGQAAQISAHVPRRRSCLLNKIDLLPHLDFDLARARPTRARSIPKSRYCAFRRGPAKG